MTDTYVYIPKTEVLEGSSFTGIVYFRTGSSSDTPSTAKYRVDCLTTGKNLTAWTSLTPSTSVNISVTATENAIQDANNKTETKQLTVAADPDTASQTRSMAIWKVKNIQGF